MMRTPNVRSHQRGVSLMVTLMFMVILAMLGIAIGNVSVLEEKMAGNTRNRDLAFQAAEAAIRDAEMRLNNTAFRATAFPILNTINANSAAYWDTCFSGTSGACATKYTPTITLPQSGDGAVFAQPQYVVEQLAPVLTSSGPPAVYVYPYRVTARGVGGTEDTVVILQSEFEFTASP
jgi:type IV pilus assembly protein PilX